MVKDSVVGAQGAGEFGSGLNVWKGQSYGIYGYDTDSVLWASAKADLEIDKYSLWPDQSRILK